MDGVHVVVSKLSDGFHTAQLHWLPFWIPHSDVEQSLSILLGDKVTCTYIRIPQKGFEGCFSTQRSIQSPANLAKLPYFVNIVSEGVLHKSCLFVPGRPQICFKCHLTGHMKSSCKAENITQAIANPVKPDEEENSEQSSDESQMVDEKDIPDSYMISINHESYIQVQGQDCVITPPDYSDLTDLTDYDFCIANLKCNKKTHSCDLSREAGKLNPCAALLRANSRLKSLEKTARNKLPCKIRKTSSSRTSPGGVNQCPEAT